MRIWLQIGVIVSLHISLVGFVFHNKWSLLLVLPFFWGQNNSDTLVHGLIYHLRLLNFVSRFWLVDLVNGSLGSILLSVHCLKLNIRFDA